MITPSEIIDDPLTYESYRTVASILSVVSNTRPGTSTDISGIISALQLDTVPPNIAYNTLNSYIDYGLPSSSRLNIPICDGVVVTQPFGGKECKFVPPHQPYRKSDGSYNHMGNIVHQARTVRISQLDYPTLYWVSNTAASAGPLLNSQATYDHVLFSVDTTFPQLQ
jgi:hypothetical protein